MEDSSIPPPYTPTSAHSADLSDGLLSAGLRGGDAQPSLSMDDPLVSSAVVYFLERPCTVQGSSHVLNHALVFSPSSTRDDFPFPQPEDQYRSRDVTLEDWNTFLNYLLPIDRQPIDGKAGIGRLRSKDTLRDRDRIETVLDEWHQGFFEPRGIRFEARFSTDSHLEMSPPPPFTSTADVGFYPQESQSANRGVSMPSQQPTFHQPGAAYGPSPLQWARNNLANTRLGNGPLSRLLSGNKDQHIDFQPDFRSCRGRHKHDMREGRGRSSSSSSTSSSSSSASSGSGHGGRGFHHGGGHRGGGRHRGRGRHHHHHGWHHHGHRSPSSSSSSSSSSCASISSSDFSGADADEIRRSFVALRENLHNKAYLSTAIRQFKNEIRQSRRQHHDVSRSLRETSKEHHHQLKAQRKGMKAELKTELKSLVKEARAVRKADRKVRKAERKAQRAHRKAEKRGTDANAHRQEASAKAEATALKAQKKAIKVGEMTEEKVRAAEERARAEVDRKGNDSSRPELVQSTRDEGLVHRTRSLGVDNTKKQENGVCTYDA
ncbi:MAG: hypothetical protein Q9219_002593 [cf. Caloplaca sp. 3 TL-2023]